MQTNKHKGEARDYIYTITNFGTPIDLCVECRKAFYEWIGKRKEENGMLKNED
ncbi:hypothetical protein ACR77V_12825 [Staphylococcus epidermidis]|uniref:hypothetical protein n=1 Tax=Staphylococcus epidermidis TaxID=1282 RepID=UPI003DA244E8